MSELKVFTFTLYISTTLLLLLQTHTLICNANTEIDHRGAILMTRKSNVMIRESMELEEPMMESEISRRVLVMQRKFISYETLKRDMVPCGTPGASYYNCRNGQAHPYNRGCEVITRCARNVRNDNN